jgi:caffeoyl-CoA O-methyltransferase
MLVAQCAGVAIVSADPEVREAVISYARTVALPITALSDRDHAFGWVVGQVAAGFAGSGVDQGTRSFGLSPSIERYIRDHFNPSADPVTKRLADNTVDRFGGAATMAIGEDQGRLLKIIAELLGARRVVEVGTFTGTSALWLARGVGPQGSVTCFEADASVIELARVAWHEGGVEDRILVVLGPAIDGLRALPLERTIDLSFVDADKPNYRAYVELLLERTRPGGVVLVDNTLWGGAVANLDLADEATDAIRAFNDWLTTLDDVDVVILSIGDGVTLIRRNV